MATENLDRMQIIETFSSFVKLSTKCKANELLERVDEEGEKEREVLFKKCLELIERHKLYDGNNPENFIMQYVKDVFDKRSR